MPMSMLGPLVHKFTAAYLDAKWSWPRRFVPLTDVSFLLTDPRADELDVEELRKLSDDLQVHLFGAGDDGEVALLVFEGPHGAVTQFAAMDAPTVAAAVADPSRLPEGGRLTRIISALRVGPPADEPAAQPAAGADDRPAPPAWQGFQGVYFAPRQVFFGDVVMCVPHGARTHVSIIDGPEHAPRDHAGFDAACVEIAIETLAGRSAKGPLLYVPISFTSLVRPSLRKAYQDLLARLPAERRAELAACIYDVPRDPAFTGLKQARALLEPHMSVIDLTVSDPGFEIEKLPAESVNSVTLMLPDGEPLVRLAALRRYASQLLHFKQRRIWPGVTNVRRPGELEAAVRLHIPFVTGPAVCSPVPTPVGGRTAPLANLPLSLNESRFPRPTPAPRAAAAGVSPA